MNQWRRFQFFDERILTGSDSGSGGGGGGLSDDLRRGITCSGSGRGHISFGSDEGIVYVCDRWLRVKLSFAAHGRAVLSLHQLRLRNILITVGEEGTAQNAAAAPGRAVASSSEDTSSSSSLKFWDLDNCDAHDTPTCIRTLDLFSAKFPPSKVTAFAVLELSPSVWIIAVALASGAVDLLRADAKHVARLRLPPDSSTPSAAAAAASAAGAASSSSGAASGGGAAESAHSTGSAVTGLGFRCDGDREHEENQQQQQQHLFVVTAHSVRVFSLSGLAAAGGGMPQAYLIGGMGAQKGCTTMSANQDLVVARREAFYFYNDEGPGPCYVLDCEKKTVGWFRDYLLCACADARKPDRTLLLAFDLKHKLAVHSSVLVGEVEQLVCDGVASVVLLVRGGPPVMLVEKDMHSKLAALFQKSLYGLALSLVQAQSSDARAIANVMQMYGDHLYSKQDYEGAMEQYVRTIGQLEPSYVIQKYLATQRVHLLTLYLERLHDRRAATPDHTTLLLNCYAKLKNVEKLDRFIRGDTSAATASVAAAVAGSKDGGNVAAAQGVGVCEVEGSGISTSRVPLGTHSSSSSSLSIVPSAVQPNPSYSAQALGYDADTVVRVCRAAGFYEQALYVALRAGDHARHLSILFDDLGRFQEGLRHIALLPQPDMVRAIKQYGPVLVAHCPSDITALILSICIDDGSSSRQAGGAMSATAAAAAAAGGTAASTSEAAGNQAGRRKLSVKLLPINGGGSTKAPPRQQQHKVAAIATGVSPMEFADMFVDHPREHVRLLETFLERVSESCWHREVFNALLELYLCFEVLRPFPDGGGSSSSVNTASSINATTATATTNATSSSSISSLDVGDDGGDLVAGSRGVDDELGSTREPSGLACAQTDPEAWARERVAVALDKELFDRGEWRLGTSPMEEASGAVGRAAGAAAAAAAEGAAITGAAAAGAAAGFTSGSVASLTATSKPAVASSSLSSSSLYSSYSLSGKVSGFPGGAEEGSRAWFLAKAGKLLKSGWPQQGGAPRYDAEQALLTCEVHGFREGLLFLYERLKMFKEVIAMHMTDGDLNALIACCKRLADPSRGGDPSLWADVLAFFGELHNGNADSGSSSSINIEAEVREALDAAERDGAVAPLQALHNLARNKSLTLAVVKDYVVRQLRRDTAAIEEDRRAIQRYQEETRRYKAELHDLQTNARVFQSSKCSDCGAALDLPAVHFLCMHSFHLRCLGDRDHESSTNDRSGGPGGSVGASECPKCAPANRTVVEMRKSLEASANDHDRFFQELHDAKDGFSVIAEYFGRSIMTKPGAQSQQDVERGGDSVWSRPHSSTPQPPRL